MLKKIEPQTKKGTCVANVKVASNTSTVCDIMNKFSSFK